MSKELEERIKRLEDWIHSMHIILKAHSGVVIQMIDVDDEQLKNLAMFDQIHTLLDYQMNKYLGKDEAKEE